MPSRRSHHPNPDTQQSLLAGADGLSVQLTRKTPDEQRWETEQASAQQARQDARRHGRPADSRTAFLVLPERRCGRCQHWTYPSVTPAPKHYATNPFGDCGATRVITERVKSLRLEKGEVVGPEQLTAWAKAGMPLGGDVSQPLRTMVQFGCPSFEALPVALDPDADFTDEAIDRFREVAS